MTQNTLTAVEKNDKCTLMEMSTIKTISLFSKNSVHLSSFTQEVILNNRQMVRKKTHTHQKVKAIELRFFSYSYLQVFSFRIIFCNYFK